MYQRSESFLQSRQTIHKDDRTQKFEEELNNLFNKKYKFHFSRDWTLPALENWFTEPPWCVPALKAHKSRLNFHKSQLNDFNIEEWSGHTRKRNPAGEVCWKIRSHINPEFLTQAWTKFYECAYSYNIVPELAVEERRIVSLHLCEAPGAFITSLNHFLKSHHPEIKWQWIASTLNPYYEGNSPSNMISDDRFMFHTMTHWDFGCDNTGNLMDWDNSQAIIKRAKDLGKVHLVTADGSIDCLQKPDAQEEVTSPLHYCEIITALQALCEGGSFIFKLFTLFEHSTVSLLYMVNHFFHDVNIYKPVTSRQGNSEVYAVCLGFYGSERLAQFLPVLKSAYGTGLYSDKAMFPLEGIPEDFLKQVDECAYYFCSIQCQVINNNLQAYLLKKQLADSMDLKKIRSSVALAFLNLYNLRPLTYEHEILKGLLHQADQKINTNPRYHRGSYSEREMYTKMSLKEKAKYLTTFLKTDVMSNPSIFINDRVRWMQMNEEDSCDINLAFTHGKPLQTIQSSKFIFIPIFKLYQLILTDDEFREFVSDKESLNVGDLDYLERNMDQCETLAFPECKHTEDYSTFEKRCFQTVRATMERLNVGNCVLLQNFNTLTHFNVSILNILCKCFERTGFLAECGILLFNFTNKEVNKYLSVIEKECREVRELGKDVLSSLPVRVTNADEFFNSIVFYNNTFYRNKCQKYLSAVADKIENN